MMRNKKKIVAALFLISFFFALLSISSSAALSQVEMKRTMTAGIAAADNNGLIQLDGLANETYRISSKLFSVGSITNHTEMTMNLTVTICPSILLARQSWLKIMIGDKTTVFSYSAGDFKKGRVMPKQLILLLRPEESMDVQAAISKDIKELVKTEFCFAAVAGDISISIDNSQNTQRSVFFYTGKVKNSKYKAAIEYNALENTNDDELETLEEDNVAKSAPASKISDYNIENGN